MAKTDHSNSSAVLGDRLESILYYPSSALSKAKSLVRRTRADKLGMAQCTFARRPGSSRFVGTLSYVTEPEKSTAGKSLWRGIQGRETPIHHVQSSCALGLVLMQCWFPLTSTFTYAPTAAGATVAFNNVHTASETPEVLLSSSEKHATTP